MSDRFVVPRLLSRQPTMWVSVIVTVVGLVVLSAYFATKPDDRVAVVVLDVVLVVFFGFLLSRRVVVDTRSGTVTREMAGFLRKTVSWDQAKIVTVPTGQTLLTVGPAKIALAADDLGGKRVQPPEVLELLAAQVEQWAPEKVSVLRELRSLATGRPPGRSRR